MLCKNPWHLSTHPYPLIVELGLSREIRKGDSANSSRSRISSMVGIREQRWREVERVREQGVAKLDFESFD